MYEYIRTRLRKLSNQLRHVPRTMSLVWTAASRWTAAWLVLLVLQGLLPIVTVYLTRALVNSLVPLVRSGGGWSNAKPVIVLAALIGVVMLASHALRSATAMATAAQAELTSDYVNRLVHRKSVDVDLAFYESPDCFDHLHRARAEGSYRPVAMIESLGGLLQNAITLVAMVAVLIPFGPMLPLALVFSTLPALLAVLQSSRRRFHWNQRRTAMERTAGYYDWVLTSHECAAEIRAFNLGEYFCSAFQGVRGTLRAERLALAKQQGMAELLAGVSSLLITAAAFALMVWRAILGLVSLGDLALFYQAFNQGLGLARSLLESVGRLYENSLFLGNLFEFLALPSQIVSPAVAAPMPAINEGLAIRNVTFRYPGTDRFALRNLDLDLRPGQVSAIVGPNGAGKSTLLKLIARLHDPEQGTICLDGIPLAELSLEDLRKAVSIVFQTPIHFNASAGENIRFGDLAESDEGSIRQAAAAAGMEELIASLPNGFDTRLGKQFLAGTDLSTGEWQRIAIARAFLRAGPMILLDEPTSAMDPWAEIKWLGNLRRFVKGRITVLVTHRFSTAMFADVIHVMAGGRIVESGTHRGLLARGGLYAAGWATQRGMERTSAATEC